MLLTVRRQSAWKVTLMVQESEEMEGKRELRYHTSYLEQLRLKHSLLLTASQAFLAEEQKGHLEAAIPQTTRGRLANAHLPKPNL